MIIDSHAYCFAAADSLMGYDSVAEHLRWAQAGQAGHYQPAFSLVTGVLAHRRLSPLMAQMY